MARDTLIKVEGLERIISKCDHEKLVLRQVRKAMRLAAKAAKAKLTARARTISRTLTRSKVKVARDAMSVQVIPTAAWANTAEKGRHPGARMPPPGALRGGYPAARRVAERGLRPRPFVGPATQDSAAEVQRILEDAGKEIQAEWLR